MNSRSKSKLRPWLLGGIALLVMMQLLVLKPALLEDVRTVKLTAEAITGLPSTTVTLAPAVPRNQIPEYTIESFRFASSHRGKPQWQIRAQKAFMYNRSQLVHTRGVVAQLYDGEGKITEVQADEAQYFLKNRDLELFGNVRARFPDGFETQSAYLRYLPAEESVRIPPQYEVTGFGSERDGTRTTFASHGMSFDLGHDEVRLLQSVRFEIEQPAPNPRKTRIESDQCRVDRSHQLAEFTMSAGRPLADRFVKIRQTNLFARSRTADLRYGQPGVDASGTKLEFLTLRDDVFVRERSTDQSSLRYATGGRADFEARSNTFTLREFPQVYQDRDTITGDVIRILRDQDTVEVENSNAFSEGKKPRE